MTEARPALAPINGQGVEVIRLVGAIVGGALVLWQLGLFWGFWIDDSFISMRYGRMFAAGEGLVFNPGERVEGYTNFGWALVAGVLHLLLGVGADITIGMKLLGAGALVGLVVLTALAARLPIPSCEPSAASHAAFAAVLAFAVASYTPFVFYAVGGMETISVIVIVGVWAVLYTRWGSPRLFLFLVTFLLPFLRFDAIFLTMAMNVALGAHWWLLGRDWRRLLVLWGIFSSIYLTYHGWRYWYYGSLLPNTWYAKVQGREDLVIWRYTLPAHFHLFVQLGWWWSVPAVVGQLGYDAWRRNWTMVFIVLPGVLFGLYCFRLPWDWMPFGRFTLPVSFVYLLALVAFFVRMGSLAKGRWAIAGLGAGALAVFLMTPLYVWWAPWRTDYSDIAGHYDVYTARFVRASRMIGAVTRSGDLVYTDLVGAPGYYSAASILDGFGLNDETTAREGIFLRRPEGTPAFEGKIHPAHVAAVRPDFLLIVTLAGEELNDFRDIPQAVFIADQLAQYEGFLEQYRVGVVTDGLAPPLYAYFLQRADLAPRRPGHPFMAVRYEPLPATAAREFAESAREQFRVNPIPRGW